MLVISKEQMERFREYDRNRFYKKMVQYLKQRYPKDTKSITLQELESMVVNGVKKAAGYGITDENDTTRFLQYLIEFGTDFGLAHHTEWAYEILNNPKLNGTMKMNHIDDFVLFTLSRN